MSIRNSTWLHFYVDWMFVLRPDSSALDLFIIIIASRECPFCCL